MVQNDSDVQKFLESPAKSGLQFWAHMFFGVGERPALRLILDLKKRVLAEAHQSSVGERPALCLILDFQKILRKTCFCSKLSVIYRREAHLGGHFSGPTPKKFRVAGKIARQLPTNFWPRDSKFFRHCPISDPWWTEFSQSNAGFRKIASSTRSFWYPEMGVGERPALCLMLDLKNTHGSITLKHASEGAPPCVSRCIREVAHSC